MRKTEFIKGMKLLETYYQRKIDNNTINLWYQDLQQISANVFYIAIKSISIKSKYMPSIAEIIEECSEQKQQTKLIVLAQMFEDNYFKNSWEYEKAIKFVEYGVIPQWLLNDMKKYLPKVELTNNIKMLEAS